ncbi:MAG: 2'-5' RNA ligase family protein [Candidatus Odinarchaeota archaeon]
MPYAIVLSFDEESSFPIYQIFKRFKDKNIGLMHYDPKLRPHITLNTYENINTQTAKERLSLFSIENLAFKIQNSSIGYFPVEKSVIFLNPKASNELLTIQQKIFSLFKDFESTTSPLTWVPHCTLGMYLQKEDITKAIDIIKEEIVITEENPFYIQTRSISLVKFEREPLEIDWWLDYPLKDKIS